MSFVRRAFGARFVSFLACCLVLGGCMSAAPKGAGPSGDGTDAPPGDDVRLETGHDALTGDTIGAFTAHVSLDEDVYNTRKRKRFHSIMTLDGTVTVLRTASGIVLSLQPGTLTLPSDDPRGKPFFEPSVLASVAPVMIPVRFENRADGVHMVSDEVALVLGANLASPLTDELPTNARDPRLVDIDRDRHPGVSMKIESPIGKLSVYESFRLRLRLDATLQANGNITGIANAHSDAVGYGDDVPFNDVPQQMRDADRDERVDGRSEVLALVSVGPNALSSLFLPPLPAAPEDTTPTTPSDTTPSSPDDSEPTLPDDGETSPGIDGDPDPACECDVTWGCDDCECEPESECTS